MDFQKDFDELLDAILTDYRNQSWNDPATGAPMATPDTSQGSLIFIKSACLASALWGLYKYQDFIAAQIFPDTADTLRLEHHAWLRGINRAPGETDSALLERLLADLRNPAAGGNQYDYVRWALEVAGVAGAKCFACGNGIGTVDVLIWADADSGSEVPDAQLLSDVHAYINDLNPCEMADADLRVLPITIVTQAVEMVLSGGTPDAVAAAEDVGAYMRQLEPGQTLYLSQLMAIGLNNGAQNATVITPAASVTVGDYQVIRPDTVMVTVA